LGYVPANHISICFGFVFHISISKTPTLIYIIVEYSKIYRKAYKYLNIIRNMAQTEQTLADMPLEDFAEKIERAKKLFSLYNNITFGSKIESTQSRIILQKIK
jgi:hypothetical protein